MVPTNTAPFLKFDDENARRCVRDVLDWEEWSRGQLQPIFQEMVEHQRLYLGDRKDTRLAHETWRALVHVPAPYYHAETITAATCDVLNAADPPIQAEGIGDEDLEAARGVERLLEHTLRRNRWQGELLYERQPVAARIVDELQCRGIRAEHRAQLLGDLRGKQTPEPDIITESGRAITAHHAVLITNVTDIESAYREGETPSLPERLNPVELYHDAQFELAEARARFAQDKLDIEGLAQAENAYAQLCRQLQDRLNTNSQSEAPILQELNEKLADKVFCNFSLFQSMPDIWGIDQIFPIMPIHRLDERPCRRAVLQDLTCDSDGRIDQYIDGQNMEKTLPVHRIDSREPYFIGFFMVGAYQEILGESRRASAASATIASAAGTPTAAPRRQRTCSRVPWPSSGAARGAT